MEAIDALQRFHTHGEEARRLPEIGAILHEPSRCRVPHSVR